MYNYRQEWKSLSSSQVTQPYLSPVEYLGTVCPRMHEGQKLLLHTEHLFHACQAGASLWQAAASSAGGPDVTFSRNPPANNDSSERD